MKGTKLWSCLICAAVMTTVAAPLGASAAGIPPIGGGRDIWKVQQVAVSPSPSPTAVAAKAAVKPVPTTNVRPTEKPAQTSAVVQAPTQAPSAVAASKSPVKEKENTAVEAPPNAPASSASMAPASQMPAPVPTGEAPDIGPMPEAASAAPAPELTQEPAVTPDAAPEKDPSENIQKVTPEPVVTPDTTPEATEEATAEPAATPETTAEPAATPEAATEPTATPEAAATPEATAEATATPEATAEPDTQQTRTKILDLTKDPDVPDSGTGGISSSNGVYSSTVEGWTWYGDGYTGSDYDKNTLVLNDANIKTIAGGYAVRLPENATLVINGNNTIDASDAQSTSVYGIYGNGALKIKGDGTLTVTASDSAVKVKSSGITVENTTIVGSSSYGDTSSLVSTSVITDGSVAQYAVKSNNLVCKTVKFTATAASSASSSTSSKIESIKRKTSSRRTGSQKYEVEFDVNGGDSMASKYMHSGAQLGVLDKPTRSGYVFAGWYLDADCTEAVVYATRVRKNLVLYAKWIKSDSGVAATTDSSTAVLSTLDSNKFILTIGKFQASVWGDVEVNDVAPIIVNERTMLPARFVAENLGADVDWSQDEQKVTITKSDTKIEIYIGADTAYVNGSPYILDSPAFVSEGTDRTYTPVRFVAENLGAKVDWDGDNQQVIITLD